jgi:type IV pilus assembly protein PilB
MSFLARGQRDVVSVETPILWTMEGVRQVEAELDDAQVEESLRSVVAVRPEVVMLSALPAGDTALLAAQLASSILVVAQFHAQSAAGVVTALLEMRLPPQLLAGCLAAVSCQRLVRQICRICRRQTEPPAPQTLALHGITPQEAATLKFFRGQGCPTCNKVGYRGRRAIFEVLTGAPELRTALMNRASTAEIQALAASTGMTALRDRCLALVREGITTFDEFTRLRL